MPSYTRGLSFINITPLVDVLLVVMVVLVLGFGSQQRAVNHVGLPKVGEVSGERDVDSDFVISLTAEGSLIVNGTGVSTDQLETMVRGREVVRIEIDAQTPYQLIANTLTVLTKAHVKNVDLPVEIAQKQNH